MRQMPCINARASHSSKHPSIATSSSTPACARCSRVHPERDLSRSAHRAWNTDRVLVVTDLDVSQIGFVDRYLPLSRLDQHGDEGSYLIAWEDDQPVGHARISWSATHLGVPEIQDVYVTSAQLDPRTAFPWGFLRVNATTVERPPGVPFVEIRSGHRAATASSRPPFGGRDDPASCR